MSRPLLQSTYVSLLSPAGLALSDLFHQLFKIFGLQPSGHRGAQEFR